jgi:hypothetical protein
MMFFFALNIPVSLPSAAVINLLFSAKHFAFALEAQLPSCRCRHSWKQHGAFLTNSNLGIVLEGYAASGGPVSSESSSSRRSDRNKMGAKRQSTMSDLFLRPERGYLALGHG